MLEKLNLERVESADIDDDTANILMQLEQWFQSKIDSLQTVSQVPESASIVIGDIEITESRDKMMFRTGVSVALSVLGKFPITLTDNKED